MIVLICLLWKDCAVNSWNFKLVFRTMVLTLAVIASYAQLLAFCFGLSLPLGG